MTVKFDKKIRAAAPAGSILDPSEGGMTNIVAHPSFARVVVIAHHFLIT